MASYSSILALEIPWTKEPGGREPIGSQRFGHDLATKQYKYLCISVCVCVSFNFVSMKIIFC